MANNNRRFLILCGSFLLAACFLLSGEEKTLTVIQTADLHGAVAKNRIFRTAELVRRVTEQNGGVECSIRIDC